MICGCQGCLFPSSEKEACWVRKSKARFVNALIGPSSDGDVIVSQCTLPHSLFFHSITLSFLHLPSGPILASVTTLHGLNSRARMQAKVQGQNISQLVLWRPSATHFYGSAPKSQPMWLASANCSRSASCLLLPFAWVTTRPAVAEGVIHHTPVCADAQGFSAVLKRLPSITSRTAPPPLPEIRVTLFFSL